MQRQHFLELTEALTLAAERVWAHTKRVEVQWLGQSSGPGDKVSF